jgi:hypothetical protein
MTDAPVIWEPTPKQGEFLSASEFEVLYGGAAGGGKSDALVIDGLGLSYGAVQERTYRGLIFRRSYPELTELIDRSKEIYNQIIPGCKFKETDRVWEFPSGAKLYYGYLENDKDRFRYQGKQFQYVGWDELTQWPTDVGYKYLLSRIRSPNNTLPKYCRSTCNPGGFGHEWVRERWAIEDEGGPTLFDETIGDISFTRRFIPARLTDNPHLVGTGYEEQLQLLSEMEKRALLEGRWDVVDIEGAIYKAEIERAVMDKRICTIPIDPGLPINTFWDIGRNDVTAIWFHQRVGLENRFIDYYEASGESLHHYAKALKDKGYLYGDHYLPHDIEVTELSTNKSRKQLLESLGVNPLIVVPRVENIGEGLEMTRRLWPSCWFDKNRCEIGLRALRNYRRHYDEKLQVFRERPVHDWASNGADAFRQCAQGYQAPSTVKKPRRRRNVNWRTV